MTANEVVFAPVRKLAEMLRTGYVSPVELTELFLNRLESIGPNYNAVVTLTADRALKEARRAQDEITAGRYLGPLHGIPYGIKDLFATDGIPTSWGSAMLKNQVFDFDSTVAANLKRAGAILCAKLAMVELAGGIKYSQANNTFTGPGINPWGGETWAGGSSSGSGSAVAAGLVPFAIGSETWGSIILPSANCGLSGLRPTYGRVSRHGAMALSWTLDKPGPMCQTADDCGLILEAISGPDRTDIAMTNRPYKYEQLDRKTFNIAVLKDATDDIDTEIRDAFIVATEQLGKMATIEEVELPNYPYPAVTSAIFMSESASVLSNLAASQRSDELTAPEMRHGLYARSASLSTDYLRAMRIRKMIAIEMDQLLSKYDALVAPSRPAFAYPLKGDWHSIRSKDVVGAMGNAIGLPAISVPSGFSKDGLPAGILFIGRAYEENRILAVASAYQSMTGWHNQHPNVPESDVNCEVPRD